jgi:hypothetical protein
MKINHSSKKDNMKRKLLAVIGIFAMLLGQLPGSVFAAAPASAQVVVPVPGPVPAVNAAVVNDGPTVEPGPKIYLPMVVASGQSGPPPASTSPYAAALSQALADCADMALNQVCYAAGSVTLDGSGPLTTPGQVANLEGVSGLRLVSPDAGHWSVALLRLAADSPTPGLGLTLLAFGNVEIRSLTLFDAAAGNGDVAPSLSFSSSPVPGEDPVTGSLIVYNPNHEEPLSIRLNGADLTLASSAVVQAQPGVKMTVTMATGSALVNTAAGDGALIQTYQLSVPLNGDGTAAGAPTTPTLTDDELLEPLVPRDEDDLLTPLVPPRPAPTLPSIEDKLLADFNSAEHRCMQGDSRQVYRVMYFARLLKLYNAVPDDLMSLIDVQVSQCATFEIEFNSVITGTSSSILTSMYIQGQGMIVSYDMDGHLDQPATMPLTHLRYDVDFEPVCPYQVVLADGALNLYDGYMRINRNRLDISTKVGPVHIYEHIIYNCPASPPVELQSFAFWRNMFADLHKSEIVDNGNAYLFAPAHWKYTGNQILAEAIFTDRKATFWDGVSTGNTWLVMLHKPGG